MMDANFGDALANRPRVTGVAVCQPVQPRGDRRCRPFVPKPGEPLPERRRLLQREHADTVVYTLHGCKRQRAAMPDRLEACAGSQALRTCPCGRPVSDSVAKDIRSPRRSTSHEPASGFGKSLEVSVRPVTGTSPRPPTPPLVVLVHPCALGRPRAGRHGPWRAPDPGLFLRMPAFRARVLDQSLPPDLAPWRAGRRSSRSATWARSARRRRFASSPGTGPHRDRGRPRISSQGEGGQGSHHGWRRLHAVAARSPSSPSATVLRQCGQLQVLDDAVHNFRPFGVRGARVLDKLLRDAGLPCLSSSCSGSWRSPPSGSPASGSRSCICGQPSILERSSRNSAVLDLSLLSVRWCRRPSGPWIHGSGARHAIAPET